MASQGYTEYQVSVRALLCWPGIVTLTIAMTTFVVVAKENKSTQNINECQKDLQNQITGIQQVILNRDKKANQRQ